MATVGQKTSSVLADRLGLCQWFHYQDYANVEQTLLLLDDLGIRHLRTGISWADYHRRGGPAWYDWQMRTIHNAGIEPLLSIWHTPPSISEGGCCSAPPRRLGDYADFLAEVIQRHGDSFTHLELWNEPNNRIKWNFPRYDPDWCKFGTMIRLAAAQTKLSGKTTVLGGIIPVDAHWLHLMQDYGALEAIDVIAIHAFPGMWWQDHANWDWHSQWQGWPAKLSALASCCATTPWVTETGFATWDHRTNTPAGCEQQTKRLMDAIAAPTPRLYWYSAIDLAVERPCIEMTVDNRIDHHEYHLGLVRSDGSKKPAYYALKEVLAQQREQPLAQTPS